MNEYNIIKVSSDMYYTKSLSDSTKKCKSLSEIEQDLFTVVYGYSETLDSYVFFIERGIPLIRNGETLVCEYEKGVKIR